MKHRVAHPRAPGGAGGGAGNVGQRGLWPEVVLTGAFCISEADEGPQTNFITSETEWKSACDHSEAAQASRNVSLICL